MSTDSRWEQAFKDAYTDHGLPPHVAMAIIYQESRFVHDAYAPSSGAYGYAQALDQTWEWYQEQTGKSGADRDHLPDAVDFIGWYVNENHRRTGVSKWDAAEQYLAYHDGTGGYLRGTHRKKPWLLKVAKKVGNNAARYRAQLPACYQFPR